ncbi:oxidoreductase domain protein [Pirellula staleyi DSM 6068]|uniref:Oxidoreductase domain protein n=1 Tax=Pirellula staleyi (strain ATCC 27377 / DSM 6068 / ICPB 4128) TaxID=530564 RepID=D2R3L6_PIRSD|nr:Gfo/Idh/MocA family oxidoreductase [Pirellula staleyi]ADB16970.1 oxidoreductase domain protein [Pirellula staleyi DSM 6068]
MLHKYRVAVIGETGRGNYGHGIDTVWLRMENCEIVGVADRDEKGLAAAAARLKAPKTFADYRQLLDTTKPDIVAICPRWLDQHAEMAIAAADRGIHIYMEKPFCRTPAEADAIVAACEKTDVKLALAHQTRYSPVLQTIHDLIGDGLLGTVLEYRARGKEDQRGGVEDLWVLGSHVLNLVHHFGGEPEWCFAQIRENGAPITKKNVREGAEGIGPLAGDRVDAMFGLASGATAYFGSQKEARGDRFGVQIFGSKGIVEVLTGHLPKAWFVADPNWSAGRSQATWKPITSAGIGLAEPIKEEGQTGGNILAVTDLMQAIEEDRQPECSMYEGRTTVEMISAVMESQRIGARVGIPLTSRVNPLTLLT